MSEAQKRAKKKYREKYKERVTRLTIDFYPSEQELIDKINEQPKKQTYIKDLIRADIEKTK